MRLRDLLKFEFFFAGKEEFRAEVRAEIAQHDPTWEQSFPDVSGIAIPFEDVSARRTGKARLSRREASARREANEARHGRLLERFEQLGLEPVVLERSDPAGVHATFIDWAERRLTERGRWW